MQKNCLAFLSFSVVFYLVVSSLSVALNSDEIIRLKKAGISDETIQLLIKEKTQETHALTVSEVLTLKRAGLSEETIRLVIKESSFMKNREPTIYGENIRPIRLSTAQDLINLKKAGLSEDVIQAIIICGAREENDSERGQAWEMLKNMGIIVDMRKNK